MNKQVLERIRKLSKDRKKVLSLPPEKALDQILHASQPAALVHSFPEEDFYYLIQDIGPEDSLPILSLASAKQWEHILDREIWNKDRIDRSSLTRWFDLMLSADSVRFIKWLIEQKTECIEYYLSKNIEVVIRETDQDPSELGKDFFTYDDAVYIRLLNAAPADSHPNEPDESDNTNKMEEMIDSRRKETVKRLLDHLAVFDYKTYQSLLFESTAIIPAETEEESYRLRNFRLAEKGFLPFEDAVGVYQPIRPEDLKRQSTKYTSDEVKTELLFPVPFYPINMMETADLFSKALRNIKSDALIEQLQSEFAALCNQVAVADQKQVKVKEELRPVVQKASGYLSIGLEALTKKDTERQTQSASETIVNYPLHQIFRIGFGTALALKWRTEAWRKEAWFEKQRLPLSFWDEKWLGLLGGLLLKKPLFYDNYRTGELYREFRSMEDIKQTDANLREIIAFDKFLFQMGIQIPEGPRRFMTYKSLLLTLWVRYYLTLSEDLIPLTLNEFKRFFDQLFEDRITSLSEKPRKTKTGMKESLLRWLSEKSGFDPHEVSRKLSKILENLFTEIESEYGSVAKKNLDPRFIYLFLVEN